ncbi:MAG: hypothetical protein ABR910_06690 [Acidobacteriaceae bacterium]|jgi:hypothetical protein
MPRKPTPHTLAAAFLLVSAGFSVALLANRNLYDDEIFSLDIVTGSVRHILRVSAEGDVHPPGMYLLAHLAYCILPSFRWMNLLPALVLYAGLAVFLFAVTPLLTWARAQLCLLLLATLHPQLLMWSATYRWYCCWTGLALITLTIAIQPREPRPALSTARAVTLGLLLACLFYLNYITFLFAMALAAAMVFRYRRQPRIQLLTRALMIAGVFAFLIAPQLHTMLTAHLPNGHAQQYSLAASVVRLTESIAASEAYLPWHPLAVLADLLFAALCITGVAAMPSLYRRRAVAPDTSFIAQSALTCLVLFGLLFFFLVAAAGLGGKPRNGLLLIPVLAPIAALIVDTLRPRAQTALLLFLTLWSAVGIAHMIGRYGLTKATMNDRPEQVVAFVRQTAAANCAVVVTYDSALAFELTQASLPQTLVVSPFRGPIFGGSQVLPPEDCAHLRLYAVQSYLGGTPHHVQTYNGELDIAEQSIEGPPSADYFSPDPYAARKRRLARFSGLFGELSSVASLPDFRYIALSGPTDRATLDAMRRRMPHFASGYEIAPAALEPAN